MLTKIYVAIWRHWATYLHNMVRAAPQSGHDLALFDDKASATTMMT